MILPIAAELIYPKWTLPPFAIHISIRTIRDVPAAIADEEERDGHHGRPPLRGKLVRHQQKQRSEGTLVHRGERHRSDGQHDRLSFLSPCPEGPCEKRKHDCT